MVGQETKSERTRRRIRDAAAEVFTEQQAVRLTRHGIASTPA